jgi:hypothetical protein
MMRMRPKANATQMHNEALGILCRSNARCPLRALFMFTEMEMKDYEGFVHKSNKSLKNAHYISTILKNTGMPHFTADRPPELGGSVERFNVTDLGLGKLELKQEALQADLDTAWEVLAEPIQTVMRRYGVYGAYEQLKEVTRGKTVSADALHGLILSLAIPEAEKQRLLAMSPASYIGQAAELARRV